MFNTSAATLKLLASLVWYSGAAILFTKSTMLLLKAKSINPEQPWIWLAVLTGLIFGIIKAKYLYRRLCIKNLKRINSLNQPKLWQFYRMRFFIFLSFMILLGQALSQLANENYTLLISMIIVEISVATALLGSSNCFWKKLEN